MKRTLILLFWIFVVSFPAMVSTQDEPVKDDSLLLSLSPLTEAMIFPSATHDEDYLIFVSLPASYKQSDRSYPVLYLLDPQLTFTIVTGQTRELPLFRELPEIIVVGIGYPEMQDLGGEGQEAAISNLLQRREQDLSPARQPEQFLEFLTVSLIPFIDSNYRTNPDDRAIMGHSFGGDFVLYALFHAQGVFHRFAASSPGASLPNERVCIACELQNNPDISGIIFLSSGELDGFNLSTPRYVEGAFTTFQEQANEDITVSMHIFEGTSHLSVVPFALLRGMRDIYCGADYTPAPDSACMLPTKSNE